MASRGCAVQCYSSCPPSTVTIQPPPFAITIPGPSLYCADQPLAIQQCNPCAKYGGRGLGSKIRLNVTDGEEGLVEELFANDEDYRRWPRRRYPGYWGPWSRRRWGYGPYGPYGGGPWGYGPYGRGPWGYGGGPWTENALEN